MNWFKLFLTIIILYAAATYMSGQKGASAELRNDQARGLIGEMVRVNGYLDHALPVELYYSKYDNECHGFIRMGEGDDFINLEGECSDSTLQLYEFDQFARVSGVLSGDIIGDTYQLMWSNHNHSLSYNLDGRENHLLDKKLKIYEVKEEAVYDHLLLWQDKNNISVLQGDKASLYWQNYNCPSALYACQYLNKDNEKKNLSISNRTVSTGNRLFQFAEELQIENLNGHSFEYFYNYAFPQVGEKSFDLYIRDIATSQIDEFIKAVSAKGSIESDPDVRLKDKAVGEFYISLASENIISGYLSYNSTRNPRLKTTAFSYDRLKKKFYRIKDIWEKDFDFLYYLKSLIENEKRKLINEEPSLIKKLLKDEPFSHFNLTSRGIVFFTDYNFVFGRRYILIPYKEIEGFIDNKSISNLINNKSRS